MRMLTLGWIAALGAVLTATPDALAAQERDTDRISRAVPRSVARELMDIYNSPRTRRETGPATIEAMRGAGCAVLAVESRRSLLLHRAETIERADAAGISVIGL